MIKKIIINADDFGLNPSVNKAIIQSFNNRLINSTTLMANMPGFDEAVELANKNNITDKIGIHLVLTGGIPLTHKIKSTNLFYNENNSDLKKHKKNLFFLTVNEKKLIFKEFAAQIDKVKNAGVQITHIDTHHHIDEVWPITKIILALLKTYNIPSMRILNNLNRSTNLYKIGYRKIINQLIKVNGANYSDFFGNKLEAILLLKADRPGYKDKNLEIMVHPDYNSAGFLIDRLPNQEEIFDFPTDLKDLINSRS